MARIPRYQADVRLDMARPYDVADPEAARFRGETIVKASEVAMKGIAAYKQFETEKEEVQLANIERQFSSEAAELGQSAANDVITNADGNTSVDGSNMSELYADKFSDLYSRAQEIGSPKARRAAIAAIKRQQVMQGQKVFTAKTQAFLAHTEMVANSEIRKGGQLVQNDPSLLNQQLGELGEYFQKLKLPPKAYIDAMEKARKDLSLSAVMHFKDKGDYAGAKAAINTFLGDDLDSAEKEKLMQSIDRDAREAKQEAITKDRENDRAVKERREDTRMAISMEVQAGLLSEDPAKRAEAKAKMAEATRQGYFTLNEFEKAKGFSIREATEAARSVQLGYEYRLREGRNLKSFVSDVMNSDSLLPKTKMQLFDKYDRTIRKRADPVLTKRRTAAEKFIGKMFPRDPTEPSQVQDAKEAIALEKFYDLVSADDSGDYMKKAMDAIKSVDPSNYGITAYESPESIEEITKRKKVLLDEYSRGKAAKNLSLKQVESIHRQLRELDVKLEVKKQFPKGKGE